VLLRDILVPLAGAAPANPRTHMAPIWIGGRMTELPKLLRDHIVYCREIQKRGYDCLSLRHSVLLAMYNNDARVVSLLLEHVDRYNVGYVHQDGALYLYCLKDDFRYRYPKDAFDFGVVTKAQEPPASAYTKRTSGPSDTAFFERVAATSKAGAL
jgi:hypothetical protein